MIKINNEVLDIRYDSIPDLLADTTLVLKEVYTILIENFEEEKANRLFAKMGRLAVISDEDFEEEIKNLI